jgi:hypothetical protein
MQPHEELAMELHQWLFLGITWLPGLLILAATLYSSVRAEPKKRQS